jgi:hypothetical protein
MTVLEPGIADTIVKLPHSEDMLAKLPVTFVQELAADNPAVSHGSCAPRVMAKIRTHGIFLLMA